MTGFDRIHELKKETGKNVPDLIALAIGNDPFFFGSPADKRNAVWFAKMWQEKFKDQTGIHLRRVHYLLFSVQYKKFDGTSYENTPQDWSVLCKASKAARILGLVSPEAFDDHRNEDPYSLNWRYSSVCEPSITADEIFWFLPTLRADLSRSDWTLDAPSVGGYGPNDYLDRAYYIELWIEKSTMDDILIPLTSELGIRLVTSSGFQSITSCVSFLNRVREIRKPTRVFYISDYDRAGRGMPIAVARQIEYWLPEYAPGANVKLTPIALTDEQIIEHKLPYSPENKLVELDALEALVPGELEKIVRGAVAPYLDPNVDDDLESAREEAKRIVVEGWDPRMREHRRKLKALQKSVRSATKKYQREAANLNKRLQRDLKQFERPLQELRSQVRETADSFQPELPERPRQSEVEMDESNWLFDTSRPYLEQLKFYKRQR